MSLSGDSHFETFEKNPRSKAFWRGQFEKMTVFFENLFISLMNPDTKMRFSNKSADFSKKRHFFGKPV